MPCDATFSYARDPIAGEGIRRISISPRTVQNAFDRTRPGRAALSAGGLGASPGCKGASQGIPLRRAQAIDARNHVHDRARTPDPDVWAFRALRPDIKLDVIDGTAQSIEERLIESQTEVAIYCRPDREPDPRLHYLPLFREQMMIVLPLSHRLAARGSIEIKDLAGERYVQRSSCEFNDMVDVVFDERGVDCETVYRSDRDDWVLAMVASGFGFGFFPNYSIKHEGVVVIPLVGPEFWREVNLTTVKGRPYSPAVGALVHEAMRSSWPDGPALAVRQHP